MGSGNYYVRDAARLKNEVPEDFCSKKGKLPYITKTSYGYEWVGRDYVAMADMEFRCEDSETIEALKKKDLDKRAETNTKLQQAVERLQTPKLPLKVLFACSEMAPQAANFQVTKILEEMYRGKDLDGVATMRGYGCNEKNDMFIKNANLLSKTKLIGVRTINSGFLGYYVVDVSPSISVGAVGE